MELRGTGAHRFPHVHGDSVDKVMKIVAVHLIERSWKGEELFELKKLSILIRLFVIGP